MLTLFAARNSICTQKVLITLYEKNIKYETRDVDLFKNEQYDPAYLKLNPKGVVPTLVHDDKPIIESTLICEYLEESFPSPPLLPQEPHRRSQARLWSKAIDEGIFEATRELSFSAMFRERMRNMTAEQREIRFKNVGDPEKRSRLMSTFENGVDSPYVYFAIAAFEKLFKGMESALGEGEWVVGNDFTLGDVNLIPFVARLEYLNLLEVWIGERPRVSAWWQRAKDRPSFKSAISDRLTADEALAMKTHGAKIRDQVATRRGEYLRKGS